MSVSERFSWKTGWLRKFPPRWPAGNADGTWFAVDGEGQSSIDYRAHRGISQGFTVVSGHVAPDDPGSTLLGALGSLGRSPCDEDGNSEVRGLFLNPARIGQHDV